MFIRSFFAVVSGLASVVGSSYLGSKRSVKVENSSEIKESTVTVSEVSAPISTESIEVAPEVKVVIDEVKEPVVVESKEEPKDEVKVVEVKKEVKEPVWYSRNTLQRHFAGGRGHRHAAFALKTSFSKEVDEIKVKDPALWYEFLSLNSSKNALDEDILSNACNIYAKKDKIYFDNRETLKNKIKGYCFTQIGFKL